MGYRRSFATLCLLAFAVVASAAPGDCRKPEGPYNRVMREGFENPKTMCEIARGFLASHLFEEAKQLADRTVKLYPRCAEAYSLRARANFYEPATAMIDLNKAIELGASDPETFAKKAGFLSNKGNHALAAEFYEKAIMAGADYTKIWQFYGQTLWQAGKKLKALDAYSMQVAANKSDVSALFLRGVTHARLGSYSLAIQDLTRCIEMKKNDLDTSTLSAVLAARSEVYERMGNKPAAASDKARLGKLPPIFRCGTGAEWPW